jgi:hypothetical protein
MLGLPDELIDDEEPQDWITFKSIHFSNIYAS